MFNMIALGTLRPVEPSGRPSTARRWFSYCEVKQASIVYCPELCGRGAISFTRRKPEVYWVRRRVKEGGARTIR